MEAVELLHQGIEAARAGRKTEARELLMQVVDLDPRNEIAWSWLSGIMDDLEDRIIACENVLTINPGNEKARVYMAKLLQKREAQTQANVANRIETVQTTPATKPTPPVQEKPKKPVSPLAEAEELEQQGRLEEALQAYEQLATRTKDSRTFDHIYKQITRLEALQKEKIQFVAPASSLNRLTWTWPLLYFSFALLQMGFNPFAHSRFYLWVALPIVVLGSFLLALSEIRLRHAVWEKLFMEDDTGSSFARLVVAIAGSIFVLVPFGLMLLDSLGRLHNFKIPPNPF